MAHEFRNAPKRRSYLTRRPTCDSRSSSPRGIGPDGSRPLDAIAGLRFPSSASKRSWWTTAGARRSM